MSSWTSPRSTSARCSSRSPSEPCWPGRRLPRIGKLSLVITRSACGASGKDPYGQVENVPGLQKDNGECDGVVSEWRIYQLTRTLQSCSSSFFLLLLPLLLLEVSYVAHLLTRASVCYAHLLEFAANVYLSAFFLLGSVLLCYSLCISRSRPSSARVCVTCSGTTQTLAGFLRTMEGIAQGLFSPPPLASPTAPVAKSFLSPILAVLRHGPSLLAFSADVHVIVVGNLSEL